MGISVVYMIDRDINICVCVHFMETKKSSCLCCSLEYGCKVSC